MKNIIYTLALCLAAGVAQAVTLTSDPIADTGVTICSYSLNGAAFVDTPVVAAKCDINVDTSPVGSNTIGVKLVKSDAVWGRLEASVVNFTYSRPAAAAAVSGLALVP